MRPTRPLSWSRAVLCALAFATTLLTSACTSTLARDASRLASLPPLPYRIAVVGGAFLPSEERGRSAAADSGSASESTLSERTFEVGVAEPIAFDKLVDILERGRLATRVLRLASQDASRREALALGDSTALEEARKEAAAAEADWMLVVEGLRDGPVQSLGVTGQWPITTIAWLLAGIGLFVPDHRFESKAKLRASLVDVASGRTLTSRIVVVPGTIDLSLIDRSDFLGIASSILVPPSLVGNDRDKVVAAVRADGADRIVLGLLARLKDPELLEALRAEASLQVEARVVGAAVELVVRCERELQDTFVRTFDASGNGRDMPAESLAAFRSELAKSIERGDRWITYRARFPLRGGDAELRFVVQDLAGQAASMTLLVPR